MTADRRLSFRRALLVFLLALAGSVTGILLGPRIVAAFDGAPGWLLPAVMMVSVLLALVAAYVAFRIASRKAQ
ncbi:hypothetical protein ACOPJQ_04710 [Luteimonas dalianensis]|uniref:hypothetical protein n=1 Tax=Luteimonas dalianensis TaxID=1148196 RepID=UPI003BF2A4A0